MTRAERIRELQDEYARRRRQNEIEQQEREREAFARDPELARLREESISLAVRSMREAMREEDAQKRARIAEAMRSGGLRINAEMRLRLQNLGLRRTIWRRDTAAPSAGTPAMWATRPRGFASASSAA